MKRFGFLILPLIFWIGNTNMLSAQNHSTDSIAQKMIFFGKRAKQDATYEQTLITNNKEDELDFWRDQKRYESDLKQHDEFAYNTYIKGKRKAYLDHAKLCGEKCNHSESYFERASFYYSYEKPGMRNTVSTLMYMQIPSIGDHIFQ